MLELRVVLEAVASYKRCEWLGVARHTSEHPWHNHTLTLTVESNTIRLNAKTSETLNLHI